MVKIIKQAQDTRNMLHSLRTHPQLSAYHVLEGPHDFNKVPFAPSGCREKSSTQKKLEQDGYQRPLVYGTVARRTSTTERGNYTYHQQVDSAHLPKQTFTLNIA